MNRRLFIKILFYSLFSSFFSFSKELKKNRIFLKKIPSSGEFISSIGMGTWLTFDIGYNTKKLKQRSEVLKVFFNSGGQVIDSSPMYGTSEKVIGKSLRLLENSNNFFAATKIWTPNTWHGKKQIENSKSYWGVKEFKLLQVHNLVNYEGHLETLYDLKNNGIIKYIGVTTSHGLRHKKLKDIMNNHELDFVQLTYNIIDNEASNYLLPLAEEKGIAVIANRPFQGGKLFNIVNDKKIPAYAIDIGIRNWAEYFLKFIISHKTITCTIPATSKINHMQQNMQALHGHIPTSKQRKKLYKLFINL
tara:strand:+ start:2174 stop:3085 length:912 start_codon:yes stop_codon:yes gene_type:complete